jgi:hypothetical protein
MAKPFKRTDKHTSLLRLAAASRLERGTAPPTNMFISTGALSFLHRLAAAPANAEDALTLLHELQVHQVELDLQYEQIEANAREFAEDLARYRALYEFAPFGYFVVSHSGNIIEGNLAGAELFGVLEPAAMDGRLIDSFLSPESRPALLALRTRLSNGSTREVCEVQSGAGSAARRLHIVAIAGPNGGSFLVTLVDVADFLKSDVRA